MSRKIPIATVGAAVLLAATLLPASLGRDGQPLRRAVARHRLAAMPAEVGAAVAASDTYARLAAAARELSLIAQSMSPRTVATARAAWQSPKPGQASEAAAEPGLAGQSPAAAIAALAGPAKSDGPTGPTLAAALLYGAPDAPSIFGFPALLAPVSPAPDLALPGLLPEPARPAEPANAPALPALAPTEDLAARLAIAAYRKGDMALGDASAATIGNEVSRVALEWVALRAEPQATGFGRLMAFLKARPDWPAAGVLRRYAEDALYGDRRNMALLAAYFAKAKPESMAGKLALARLTRAQGNAAGAAALVREVWRGNDVSQPSETRILDEFGDLLVEADHKFRADRAFYKEDAARLMRAATLVGGDEVALAKAQVAVIEGAANAEAQLALLPVKLKTDPSFLFARIQLLRRAGRPDKIAEAARLMLAVPHDVALVDGDAWWVERRLIARKLLDAGDAKTAYRISAEHGDAGAEMRIEAEFHAGWIALRFLRDAELAAPHFAAVAAIATLPPSMARAAYWRGRAAQALDEQAQAVAFYTQAAQYVTTYYGQLARAKLRLPDLPLRQPQLVARGEARDLSVRVVEFLYAVDAGDFALPIVVGAARRLDDEAQLGALGEVVEAAHDAAATLALGKLALQRGLPLDDYAFPIFGVPAYEPVANSADKSVVYAIARQESAFAPAATSSAGAKGLMQLMPATARRTAQHVGIALDIAKLSSDAGLNARIGAAHLGELFAEQGNSYILAFAAYNAGGKRVREWITAYGDPRNPNVDPIDWVERIPITETRDYVQRIIENLQVYRARFGEASRPINEAELRRRGGG